MHNSTSSGPKEYGAWLAIGTPGPGPGFVWIENSKADSNTRRVSNGLDLYYTESMIDLLPRCVAAPL